jgi:autotransporter-associated beta strand protein
VEYPSGTNNLTLIVGGTNDLNFSGPYTLNGNDGTSTYTTRTLQVDNTGLTTISGVISDGGMGFGFTKSGTGVLALNNTETYSGATTVSAGTLLVNGQLGAGAVTASGGVIGGSGTIPGNVTVQNGGGLAPGNLGIGTLTVNGTVDLQAGSTTAVEVSKTGGTHDQVAANTINYGGTLMATNLSGSIAMGDSFPIFSAASHTGDFSAIAGSPGPGLAWSFDAASGTLNVVTGVATNPTNIVFSAAGGTLSLSWPSDHTGWTLQVQTNSLANGLQSGNSSWVTVPGSTSTNAMDFPIDPANGSVFYRLIYQP